MKSYTVTLWENDMGVAEIVLAAESAREALGRCLNEGAGWPDAREWPVDEDEESAAALCPDDPHCMIEARVSK